MAPENWQANSTYHAQPQGSQGPLRQPEVPGRLDEHLEDEDGCRRNQQRWHETSVFLSQSAGSNINPTKAERRGHMSTLYAAFILGGLGMYPILATSIIIIVASIRHAIDGEPIRLRFITATAIAMVAMMLFWTVCDVVIMLGNAHAAHTTGENAQVAWVEGISAILNQWGLGLLALTLAAFAVAIGTYRAGARQLRALRP
jgi:hypothetical protein